MRHQVRQFDSLLIKMRGRDAHAAEDAFFFVEKNIDIYLEEVVAATVDSEQPNVLCWLFELLSISADPAVVPLIAFFLNDHRIQVRSSAREWLGRMDIREARIAIRQFDSA